MSVVEACVPSTAVFFNHSYIFIFRRIPSTDPTGGLRRLETLSKPHSLVLYRSHSNFPRFLSHLSTAMNA